MRTFIISAATMTAFAALLASAPAVAEYHFGPVQNGNQCWNGSSYGTVPGRPAGASNGFGYWSACPKTVSATVAPAPRHVRRHHS
jgi:hypothetical protein